MLAWAESEDDIVAKYNISQAQQESGDFNRKIFSSQIGTAMKNGFSIFGKIRVTAPNEKRSVTMNMTKHGTMGTIGPLSFKL